MTDSAVANEGLHQRLVTGDVEIRAKAVKSALDTFMAYVVNVLQHAVKQSRRCRNEDPTTHSDEPVHDGLVGPLPSRGLLGDELL